jgi:hypothetical protein
MQDGSKFPQWLTQTRRDHIVKLMREERGRCQADHEGNDQCLELRHYYRGCAMPEAHSSGLLRLIDREIEVVAINLELGIAPARVDPLAERGEMVALAKDQGNRESLPTRMARLLKKREIEVEKLRCQCDDASHYNLHLGLEAIGQPIEYSQSRFSYTLPNIKEDWIQEDREERSAELKREHETLPDGQPGKFGREWDPVRKDEYFQKRGDYSEFRLGVDVFTSRRVAYIRVPSTWVEITVQLDGIFRHPQSSKRRTKRIFTGKERPSATEMAEIDARCREAIAKYWETRRKP